MTKPHTEYRITVQGINFLSSPCKLDGKNTGHFLIELKEKLLCNYKHAENKLLHLKCNFFLCEPDRSAGKLETDNNRNQNKPF